MEPGAAERQGGGGDRHFGGRGVGRSGGGARVLIARVAQVIERQSGVALDDADAVLEDSETAPTTAMVAEIRYTDGAGLLYVFLPPTDALEVQTGLPWVVQKLRATVTNEFLDRSIKMTK